jgi:hypothetical protein
MLNHEPDMPKLPPGLIESKMYDPTYVDIITPSVRLSKGESL